MTTTTLFFKKTFKQALDTSYAVSADQQQRNPTNTKGHHHA
jgi:hypothetical protein